MLDKLQCKMLAYIIPVPRAAGEDIDHYCRRRLRLARSFATSVGKWSLLWCRRVLGWDAHVRRGTKYHFCNNILTFHNNEWLQMQRSLYTGIDDIRNSLIAGRSGTRLNIGRPQQRWEQGVALARQCLAERTAHTIGNNSLSIGSIVRSAIVAAREYANLHGTL